MRQSAPTNALIEVGRRLLGTRHLNHLVRFRPVLELIADTDLSGGNLLDVGSGSRGIAALLPPGWHATALDADFEDYGAASRPTVGRAGQVIGDVRALPFEDLAFDVAVTIDLLEHLPASDRPLAISEVCRVARRYAMFACPAGTDALAADRRLAERLSTHWRGVPSWLTEHLEHGFPEPAELTQAAGRFGSVRALGNENISAHERLIVAETRLFSGAALRLACIPLEALVTSRRRRARDLARRLLHRVGGGDRPPTYRQIIIVELADAL